MKACREVIVSRSVCALFVATLALMPFAARPLHVLAQTPPPQTPAPQTPAPQTPTPQTPTPQTPQPVAPAATPDTGKATAPVAAPAPTAPAPVAIAPATPAPVKKKDPDRWAAAVDLGFNAATGNTRLMLLTTGFRLKHRETDRFKLEWGVTYRYGESRGSVVARN